MNSSQDSDRSPHICGDRKDDQIYVLFYYYTTPYNSHQNQIKYNTTFHIIGTYTDILILTGEINKQENDDTDCFYDQGAICHQNRSKHRLDNQFEIHGG
jgi:hypothetical protein